MGRSATDTVATTPEEVLAGIAGAREQLRRIEQAQVLLAVEWAKHHPAAGPAAEPGHVGPPPRRFDVGARVWRDVAAMGCVHFDEFALAEFAIAAGLTEYAAGKLLREALLLVHLLPRVWQRVLHGGLEVWRARALAADCWGLPPGAVAFIDAQMSRATARITPSAREKVVAEARARFLPEEEKGGRARALETRGIEVDFARAHHGVVPIYGALDFADAQALEAALRTGAQALTDLGSEASLHCRRAWALGDLARAARGTGDRQVAPGHVPEAGARPHWSGKGAPPPQVKLFIHINPPAGADAGPERLVV